MDIHVIKPLEDPRWADLINQHPKASVFHTTAWLGALSRTSGYKPVAFTTSPPDGPLGNGLVACDVRSWLTGHRLVSLPFSDYCEPLFDSPDELAVCGSLFCRMRCPRGNGTASVRPVSKVFGEARRDDCLQSNGQYLLHRLDLQPQTEELFQNLDKDSVQRRIRRAERAGLAEECGRSEDVLRKLYTLLIITRRRHHLPPQPYAWFQNLVNSFGEALEIRTVAKEQIPVASILTLRFKDTVYYKYGCSDARYNNLGATPLLLWRAIVAAKSTKGQIFDSAARKRTTPVSLVLRISGLLVPTPWCICDFHTAPCRGRHGT